MKIKKDKDFYKYELGEAEMTIKVLKKQIHELQEQLKNSIVPRFKFGDYLYSVFECFGRIICGEGTVYAIQKNYSGCVSYYLKTDNDYFCEREDDCFLTIEEAHKRSEELRKLAEMRGK